ncbi:MaoC/PaaZ C-terminal domain-containing protein [Novosphingobium umbonatum]|nr:MaoC/PaaZ C-terminal domain-containing protein [Novosphingobium umbonatum]
MAVNIDSLAALSLPDVACSITPQAAILYALSIGLGTGPDELPFVYEGAGLRVFATMPVVLGDPGAWWSDPLLGLPSSGPLHGEQSLEIYGDIPLDVPLLARNRIIGLRPRGAGHLAVLVERILTRGDSGALLARGQSMLFFRNAEAVGEGFGDMALSAIPPCPPSPLAGRSIVETHATSALLYRLNGDTNPLHADPVAAQQAGFRVPILHGLLSMGLTAVALWRLGKGAGIKALSLRFTAPAYPQDRLVIDHVKDGPHIWFSATTAEARVLDRGYILLDDG